MSKKKEEKRDPMVAELVWKEIEFTCPVRGKVKQKVQVKVIKSAVPAQRGMVLTGNPLIDDFSVSDVNAFDDTISLEEVDEDSGDKVDG